jgi:hypothetical protein
MTRKTRARDELILDWLAAKNAGATWPQFAAASGKATNTVMNTCITIMQADLAHAGDSQAEIAGGYWR